MLFQTFDGAELKVVVFKGHLARDVLPTLPATTAREDNNVNGDILAHINFRGFMKMGNFAWIKIRVLSITGS